MNNNPFRISGPFTHANLTVFLVHGEAALFDDPYVTLEEALDRKQVVVGETGTVRVLQIENLGADSDVFVQAGDIVRGGLQDRTFSHDFVVPAKSGAVSVPSFCVEAGRWRRRRAESTREFSSSKYHLMSKKQRLAAKLGLSQGELWNLVAERQAKLSKSLDDDVRDEASFSSLELTLDHAKVREGREAYRQALGSLPDGQNDVVGFAFAVNGHLNSAELYGSNALFRKMWKKLFESAANEALSERDEPQATQPATEADVRALLDACASGPTAVRRVTDRVTTFTRRDAKNVLFETKDDKLPTPWVHRNYIHEVEC